MNATDNHEVQLKTDEDNGNNEDYESSGEEEEEDDDDESESDDAAGCSKDSNDVEIYGSINEKLLEEIELILKGSSVVNCTNALALNKVMQEKLVSVRERLLELLECVKKRYVSNELELKECVKPKRRTISYYSKGGTFYFKGNMFFKDANLRNCPNNPDYIYRSEVEGEMFPMDFELRGRHVWSITDKVGVVKGVKEQLLEHLHFSKKRKLGKKDHKLEKQVALHTQNLAKLWESAGEDFEIDWNIISSVDVKHRHSVYSCEAMWNVYLKPTLKRSAWTKSENSRLLQAARRYNFQDWQSIANEVGNRSSYQCFINFCNNRRFIGENRQKIKWTEAEDKRLLSAIKCCTVNGVINWNAVCARIPNRDKVNITTRYIYTLDPKISHEPFTPEEDLTLLAAVEEYGENFGCIPRSLFPNRSCIQLRGRYRNTLMNRKRLVHWTAEENQKLMDLVAQYGESSWKKCAEMLGHHSRISCRTRYFTIKNFLAKNPNATIKDIPCKVRKTANDITVDNWVEKIAELGRQPTKPICNTQDSKETTIEEKEVEPIAIAWLPKIKEETTKKKKRRKTKKLKDRLRSIELEMYHFFKYSYNFQLGRDTCTKPLTKPQSLCLIKNACDFQLPKGNQFIRDVTLPSSISKSLESLLLPPKPAKVNLTGYRFPPNWSTLMGFRALCVHSAQPLADVSPMPNVDLEKNVAVQTFRQRLRVLFYKTGLLSRLNPSYIKNIDTRLQTILKTLSDVFLQSNLVANTEERTTENTQSQRYLTPKELKKEKDKDSEQHPSFKPAKKATKKRKKAAPSSSEPCSKLPCVESSVVTTNSQVMMQIKIEPGVD